MLCSHTFLICPFQPFHLLRLLSPNIISAILCTHLNPSSKLDPFEWLLGSHMNTKPRIAVTHEKLSFFRSRSTLTPTLHTVDDKSVGAVRLNPIICVLPPDWGRTFLLTRSFYRPHDEKKMTGTRNGRHSVVPATEICRMVTSMTPVGKQQCNVKSHASHHSAGAHTTIGPKIRSELIQNGSRCGVEIRGSESIFCQSNWTKLSFFLFFF